jgi:cytochrome c
MGSRTCRPGCAGQGQLTALAVLLALSVMLPESSHAQEAGSAARGKMIFESRCIACHSLDSDRVGPALGTVFGRKAGKAPAFTYSKALRAASHVWDRDKLLAWLTNPEAVVPGQAMGYQVETAGDRLDVVSYLASLSKK